MLGPVPGSRLVELLNAGQVDGRTEIAPMGSSQFKRLAEVDAFKVHYARAEARRRVDLAAAQERAQRARRRNILLAVIGVVALALAAGSAALARYLAVHGTFTDPDEAAFAITVDPPQITLARAPTSEELIEYPGLSRTPVRAPKAGASNTTARPVQDKSARTVAAAAARQSKLTSASDDPDGLQLGQIDQGAINAVVAARQKSLYPCFMAEAKRTPGLAERIPLEFVIGNTGRVSKLWIDNPRFKSGPLYDCLLHELQKWPFPANATSGASVSLSFNIGARK